MVRHYYLTFTWSSIQQEFLKILGTGERWLRVKKTYCSCRRPSSVPRTHIGQLKLPIIPAPGNLMSYSRCHRYLNTHAFSLTPVFLTHTPERETHTIIKIILGIINTGVEKLEKVSNEQLIFNSFYVYSKLWMNHICYNKIKYKYTRYIASSLCWTHICKYTQTASSSFSFFSSSSSSIVAAAAAAFCGTGD